MLRGKARGNMSRVRLMHASPKAATDAQDVVGTQPESLEGPRGGVADDLKRLKGVGPET